MRLETLTENQIIITFIALALLLIFAHVFGNLAEKIKGPRVVDEILGGMILGGSCLFLLFPNFAITMNARRPRHRSCYRYLCCRHY